MRKKRPIYSLIIGSQVNEDLLDAQYKAYLENNKKQKRKLAISLSFYDVMHNPQQLINNIDYISKKYNINPTNCVFSISTDNYLSKHKLNILKTFSEILMVKYKNPIKVFSMNSYFSLKQVENACNQIYEFNQTCKRADLSPLEALFYAYYLATKKPYKEEERGEDSGISRSIFGFLNSNKNVCVGYTEIIINNTKIYDNNILTFGNTVVHKAFGSSIGHRTLLAYVKDKKYNIEGFYFFDPTKDKTKYGEINLNFFMLPLSDLKQVRFKYHPLNWDTIKNNSKTNQVGKSYYSGRTITSFSSEGLKTPGDTYFKWFCEEYRRKDENFNALFELKKDLTIDDVQAFMEENSKPINYLTMRELIYTTLKQVYSNKDSSKIWDLSQKTMEINTKRSKFFFVRSEKTTNPFALQAYLESANNAAEHKEDKTI